MYILQYFNTVGDYVGEDNIRKAINSYQPSEDDEDDELGHYELCVVKEGTHGTQSWGWYGDNKIVVAANGVGGAMYSKKMVLLLLDIAAVICTRLNERETGE